MSLLADPVLHASALDLLIPFAAPYRPFATALGQLAAYGMLGLGATFYIRRRIGSARWKRAYRYLPVFWLLAVAHALLVGTDATRPWALLALALPVAAAGVLLITRLTTESTARTR